MNSVWTYTHQTKNFNSKKEIDNKVI